MPVAFKNLLGEFLQDVQTLGVLVPQGLDPSGGTDCAPIINNYLNLATAGQVVYLPPSNPGGGYLTLSPIVVPSGVFLEGPQPATQSGNNAASDWGAVIKPGPSWSTSLSVPGAITFNGCSRAGVRNLWVDGTNGPAGMDCIAGTGANACRVDGVGLYNGPHRGISSVNGGSGFTDGWLMRDIVIQIMQSDGIFGRYSDTTWDNVHAQSCGASGTGDGWFIQGGGNMRLVNCRADLNQNGFTFDVAASSNYHDPVMLTNCGTQRNQQMGLRAANFSNPATERVVIKVNGGSFDGDGVNGGAGGGGFAGLMAFGQVTLIASDVDVHAMNIDVAGGCPQYALVTRINNTVVPTLVQAMGGFWNGVTALVNDAAPATLMSYSVHGYTGGVYVNSAATPAVLAQLNPL